MSLSNPSSRDTYQFSAEPKPVKSRSKYRDANEPRQSDYDQMQNDPRVRGAQAKGTTPTKGSTTNIANKVVEKTPREEVAVEDVYAPLSERSTLDESKIIPYYYIDKPPTPEFKPLEPGVDVFTQVEDRELFDFKLEVEPILQVLVGKTIEQAHLELCEEDDRLEQMRHKMTFEKKRNAELMVTQRKEALHLRKEDEKKRREKQYGIERDQKTGAHKKYISRLLAKNVMNGMGLTSTNVLADKGVLCYNVKNEMKKDYVPSLVQNTISFINENTAVQRFIEELMSIPTKQYRDAHAASVQKEVDRLQKIADDKKAEQERLEAERKKRRERRRKLRLYFAKTALLNKIQATVVNRAVEVPNVFAAEITDVFPAGKESVATIGGLIGELWIVLESLQAEQQIELKSEQLLEILVKILNDKHQQKEFPIYLNESCQQLIQDVNNQMSDDLIAFNQNKSARIDEIVAQLGEINLFQNLHTLHSQNLLSNSIFDELNKALIFIFFTSVDYKIPEKKVKETEQVQPQESVAASNVVEGGEGQGEGQGEPAQSQVQEQNQENQDQNPNENQNQDQSESQAQAQSQVQGQSLLQEPVLTQGDNSSNVVSEPPEEEFKLPEVTALEQAMVQAKKKLKLVFVNDWEFRKECDAVVRFRAPLVRETKSSKNQLETQEDENKPPQQFQAQPQVQAQEPAKSNRDKKKADKVAPVQQVQEPQEDIKEKARMLMENEDFIEPYEGTTYEQEKLELPEAPVGEGEQLKIYNTSLVDGVYVAQINERAQAELRKELIAVIKEQVPEWKELDNEALLAKIYQKSKTNEKAVLETLISDPESIPLFDVENS